MQGFIKNEVDRLRFSGSYINGVDFNRAGGLGQKRLLSAGVH